MMLKIEQLQKTYRSHWTFRPIQAVKEVTISVPRGEAFGFLGSNGAGKTTTIKCITGLIKKSSGKLFIDGQDIDTHPSHEGVSYLPEQPYFYDHLNVEETLDFLSALYGIKYAERKKRVAETLARVGLADRRRNSVRSLSKGLQQRLNLAQAIINNPKLLILDEPFSGIDPVGRIEIRNILLDLKKHGTTLFMSSHVLSDVEDICDRVSIMSQGSVKAVFRLDEIPLLYGQKFKLLVDLSTAQNIAEKLNQGVAMRSTEQFLGHSADAFFYDNYDQAKIALEVATKNRITVHEFRGIRPRLEEIFISLTQNKEGDK